MFKKLSIITAISLATFSLTACGGSDEVASEEATTQKAAVETTQAQQQPAPEAPSNPYLDANWDAFKTGVENDSLVSAIDSSVANYKQAVEKVTSQGNAIIEETKADIQVSIDEGKTVIAEQQAVFDENCQDVSSEEQANQCSSIEENIFNTQEKIKELEIEIQNRVGAIEVQMKNQLGKLKVNLMNNINKKRASEGLDKVNPFEA